MSNETLQRFLERLNNDETFLAGAAANPEAAFAAFGLTAAERAAIISGDEDALRRLAGADVSAYVMGSSSLIHSVHLRCVPHEPGTGTGTGTGTGKEDGTGPRGFAPIG
jgi:hypothetical protein